MEHASAPSATSERTLTQRVGRLVGAMTTPRDGSGKGGERLAKGIEIVVVTTIMGFFGALADRWLGTGPWIMLGLGGFTLGYQVWKLVTDYEHEMRAHEDALLPPALRARRERLRQQQAEDAS